MDTTIHNVLQRQDHFSRLLLNLNVSLSAPEHFHEHLKRALQIIGEYSCHDRIHIITIHHNMTFTVEHEWCDKQVSPVPEKWKHANLIYHSIWEEQLNTQNYIVIRDEQDADSEIHTLLEEQNCRQMLLLPLFESGSQFAFIAFMQCKQQHDWQPDEIRTLADLSSVIATQLNNHQLLNRLLQHIRKYRQAAEPVEVLHNSLRRLHADIIPTWEQVKKTTPETSEMAQLNKHLMTLDKICRILPEK